MLEHRGVAPAGMRSLDHLRELLRVADEHDVARGGAHRERVGERDLPGLVDEEVVEASSRAPRARRARPCRRRGRSRCSRRELVTLAIVRVSRSTDSGLPSLAFLSPSKSSPISAAAASTSSSRLWIALWLVEATPTVLPAAIRSAISRPDVQVLPEPGGPWITRWRAVERAARAPSARRGRSSGRRGRTARGARIDSSAG